MSKVHDPKESDIYIWRESPIDLEAPLWSWVQENWQGHLTVVSSRDLPEERTKLDWGASGFHQVTLSKIPPAERRRWERKISEENVIHILYGLRQSNGARMQRLKTSGSKRGVVVVAERPTTHSGQTAAALRTMASNVVYRRLAQRYHNNIAAFLAMGNKGVRSFESLGFPRGSLFPFMYAPFDSSVMQETHKSGTARGVVKFVYVGRLDKRHKGIDVLLSAANALDCERWTLDVVGGYGDALDDVRHATLQNRRIRYVGMWEASDVVRKLANYDICVVPSRYDGWNTVTNQALNAGLAVIATDEATSDELVTYSGAGSVVRAGDALSLQSAMRVYIEGEGLLLQRKSLAVKYRNTLSTQSIGAYLIELLKYSQSHASDTERPKAPWQKSAHND